MSFYRLMLSIASAEHVINGEILMKMKIIIIRIRKSQLQFLAHIMRKAGFVNFKYGMQVVQKESSSTLPSMVVHNRTRRHMKK